MVLEWETRTENVVGISRIIAIAIARRKNVVGIVSATTPDTIVVRVSLFDLSLLFIFIFS